MNEESSKGALFVALGALVAIADKEGIFLLVTFFAFVAIARDCGSNDGVFLFVTLFALVAVACESGRSGERGDEECGEDVFHNAGVLWVGWP